MATAVRIPVELYLRTSSYEPDAEFVAGEIRKRPMGTLNHADWQQAIQRWFANHGREWEIRAYPELRVNTLPQHYRVPDVVILDTARPIEQIVSYPPLAVFEIVSPCDPWSEVTEKAREYTTMGIPQVWIVDPDKGIFWRYMDNGICASQTFEISERGIRFDWKELRSLLQQ